MIPPICGLGWNLGLGLVYEFGLPLVQFLPLFRPCFFYARLVFSLHKNENSSSLLILDARTFLLRPRLYGEKLSRVEGSPAFPSYPGRANFSYISLQRGVNRGMQICRSVPFFTKSVDPPKFLFKSETITTSENRGVKVQR